MAQNWLKWNGVDCTTKGMYVMEHPKITRPAERSKYETIPGRSGSLTILQGEGVYDDLTLTVKCYMASGDNLGAIYAWLSGPGKVEFACRPGGVYRARVIKTVEAARFTKGAPLRVFTVTFRCSPFWYPITGQGDITITASGSPITNPGTVPSSPVIKLYGSGDVTLTLGGTVHIDSVSAGIILDWEMQDCMSLDRGTLLNYKVDGGPQHIPVGDSLVSWTGNVTRVVITPNWRYL